MPSVVRKLRHASTLPFVRGVAKFQVGSVVTMAINMVASILYARLLGAELFGLLAVVSAMAGLFAVITSYGQETATSTFLAEAVSRKDRAGAAAVMRYFTQATALSSSVYVALILGAPLLLRSTGQNPALAQDVQLVFLNTALQWPSVLAFLILQLTKRVGTVTVLENTVDALQVLLATLLVLAGWGIRGVLLGTAAVSLAAVPVYLHYYSKHREELGLPTLTECVRTMLQPGTGTYLRQGLWIAGDRTISSNLYPNVFYVLLSAAAPLQVVAMFRLAFRLATLPLSLVLPSVSRMTAVTIPQIAHAERRQFLRACRNVILGSMGLALAACAGAAIFVPPLLPYVYGQEYSGAIPYFFLLLPINLIAAVHTVSVPLLRVLRRIWLVTAVNILGITVSIGGFFLLSHSGLSAAVSTCLALLLFNANSLLLLIPLRRLTRNQSGASMSV